MIRSLRLRVALLIGVCTVLTDAYWLISGPMQQPKSYHNFADDRPMLGLPNALNVLSNFPFVLFGVMGLAFMASRFSRRPGTFLEPSERWPYWTYFVGLVLTGFGSAYYHAYPDNHTLVWDRIGLAITLTALFTGILAERLHPACARWLLVPMVLLGIGSILYWDWTERQGVGDLRLWFTVQFLPMLVLPMLLFLYPARYTRGGDLLASLLCYGLAKVVEFLDQHIFSSAGFVSGHTLKHLIAGFSAGFILLMLWKRQPRVNTLPDAATAALPLGQAPP
jgi:hypothetical protein